MTTTPDRVRRPPPEFRRAAVGRRAQLTPRMMRITLIGEELRGFTVDQPAASVRVLLPADGVLVLPTWTGNEFRRPDGSRPPIRTLTPVRADPDGGELDVDLVLHGGGAAAAWALGAEIGSPAAVSGPAQGYQVVEASQYLVAGDETALPAMAQVVAAIPPATTVRVHVEIADRDATAYPIAGRDGVVVHWHDADPAGRPGDSLVAAVEAEAVDDRTAVWVAGEAASVQRIRRHLFEERALPRSHATVRGYWKFGRTAGGE